MRHPGSGPQHTLSPQPSLTDGRGEREGGVEGERGEGARGLHTNHSQINSLLPQSTILPPFSLPHLSLSFLLQAPTFTSLHRFHRSSFQCLIFFSLCLPLHYSIHPSTPTHPPSAMWCSRVYPCASGPETW